VLGNVTYLYKGCQFFARHLRSPSSLQTIVNYFGSFVSRYNLSMTTFIPYQPRENAPSFRRNTIRKSPTIGFSNWVLRQSSQHAELARPGAGVNFADSAAFDHQDLIQERLMAREILESVDYDSTEHRAQVVRDNDDNNDDSDHDSEASELPSLQEIFTKVDEEFRGSDDLSLKASISEASVHSTRKEHFREGDNEARVNPAADTDTSVPPGANQGE
jgi:hypothetical protein